MSKMWNRHQVITEKVMIDAIYILKIIEQNWDIKFEIKDGMIKWNI